MRTLLNVFVICLACILITNAQDNDGLEECSVESGIFFGAKANCGDGRVQLNEICQLWKRSEDDQFMGLLPDVYNVRRLCWTFRTPKTSKDVEFTVSLYESGMIPPEKEGEEAFNETQPLRPALFSSTFTANVGTEAGVVSVDIDYPTTEKELFVGLRWDVCKYSDELENAFHDEIPGRPFYHYTGDDNTWLYSPLSVALRVQTTDDMLRQRLVNSDHDDIHREMIFNDGVREEL